LRRRAWPSPGGLDSAYFDLGVEHGFAARGRTSSPTRPRRLARSRSTWSERSSGRGSRRASGLRRRCWRRGGCSARLRADRSSAVYESRNAIGAHRPSGRLIDRWKSPIALHGSHGRAMNRRPPMHGPRRVACTHNPEKSNGPIVACRQGRALPVESPSLLSSMTTTIINLAPCMDRPYAHLTF
jgi:hypothetical protein